VLTAASFRATIATSKTITHEGRRVAVRPNYARAEVHRGDEPGPLASLCPEFAAQTTTASRAYPHLVRYSRQGSIPRSSRTRSPESPAGTRESPQGQARKTLLAAGIPAYPRSARMRQDRPVTPEVAGSSPVAPVENILQIGCFCCQFRRRRQPASFGPPPLMPHAKSIASRRKKRLQRGIFCRGLRRETGHRSSLIPRRSRARRSGIHSFVLLVPRSTTRPTAAVEGGGERARVVFGGAAGKEGRGSSAVTRGARQETPSPANPKAHRT
jgi:hypothetical protein